MPGNCPDDNGGVVREAYRNFAEGVAWCPRQARMGRHLGAVTVITLLCIDAQI